MTKIYHVNIWLDSTSFFILYAYNPGEAINHSLQRILLLYQKIGHYQDTRHWGLEEYGHL
jgi:hypothetical protein